jgi:hypothetical protein
MASGDPWTVYNMEDSNSSAHFDIGVAKSEFLAEREGTLR